MRSWSDGLTIILTETQTLLEAKLGLRWPGQHHRVHKAAKRCLGAQSSRDARVLVLVLVPVLVRSSLHADNGSSWMNTADFLTIPHQRKHVMLSTHTP